MTDTINPKVLQYRYRTAQVRELLELAAKAAGITGKYGHAPDDYYYKGNTEGILTTLPDGQLYVWNPLTDDGDAFRLEVKLGMRLVIGGKGFKDFTTWAQAGMSACEEYFNDNPYAATRLAIVRAAAEIGKVSHNQSALISQKITTTSRSQSRSWWRSVWECMK